MADKQVSVEAEKARDRVLGKWSSAREVHCEKSDTFSISSSQWHPWDGSSYFDYITGWHATADDAWIEADTRIDASAQSPDPRDGEKASELFDVYEIEGSTAEGNGFDYIVCRTAKEALEIIEDDIDALSGDPDKDDKVVIRFRRYTQQQLDEVQDV